LDEKWFEFELGAFSEPFKDLCKKERRAGARRAAHYKIKRLKNETLRVARLRVAFF
jgi:hypothetical protein